jgi:transcriptional regulator with XRE-family HTH domain
VAMVSTPSPAVRLAGYLRKLREDAGLTQADLAKAFSGEKRVAAATVSSWESVVTPKAPTAARLNAYARFFATRRSLQPEPRLIPLDELDGEELERFHQLEAELSGFLEDDGEDDQPGAQSEQERRRQLLRFSEPDPIVIICPEAPEDSRGPLAAADSRNLTRLHQYADADALLEIFGHIRALNPLVHVLHRLPSTVRAAELSNHLVLLGGIGWNKFTGRILSEIDRLPIKQLEHPDLATGEVFKVEKAEGREEKIYFPTTEEIDGVEELIWDVALLARLPNPFNSGRTLTVCNGVHSRGVVGAVLTVTDETVRPASEKYLADRFPSGTFAMLIRVPVVSGEALAPDLQNPDTRLFEWQPGESATGELRGSGAFSA